MQTKHRYRHRHRHRPQVRGRPKSKHMKHMNHLKHVRSRSRSNKQHGGVGGTGTNKVVHPNSNRTRKLKCSPENEGVNPFSCYSDQDLLQLRDLYNRQHPSHPIRSTQDRDIWNALQKAYSKTCRHELCWAKSLKAKSDITDAFVPFAPAKWNTNKNEWLTNEDLQKVIDQYEEKYKCFEFLGVSAIDYDAKDSYNKSASCVTPSLCSFSFTTQIKKGKTKLGVIFNTDPHNKPGEHWIALFINLKANWIFFFDSVGDPAPPEVKRFVQTVQDQAKAYDGRTLSFDQNAPFQHQKGDGQCGMYALYFIIHLLEDRVSPSTLKTTRISDEKMGEFRSIYFNPPSPTTTTTHP